MGHLIGHQYVICDQSPGDKHVWFGAITSSRKTFNLFAITFEMILYSTLHRFIGLKSFTHWGSFALVISRTVVSLQPAGMAPPFRAPGASVWADSPPSPGYFWKKIAGILSGPGTLRWPILFRAYMTSSSVYSVWRDSFMTGVTLTLRAFLCEGRRWSSRSLARNPGNAWSVKSL